VILVRCNRCNREYPHGDSGLYKLTIMKRLNTGDLIMGGEGTRALLSCENDLCESCVEYVETVANVKRYEKEPK
jgi:hypothetical protein